PVAVVFAVAVVADDAVAGVLVGDGPGPALGHDRVAAVVPVPEVPVVPHLTGTLGAPPVLLQRLGLAAQLTQLPALPLPAAQPGDQEHGADRQDEHAGRPQ